MKCYPFRTLAPAVKMAASSQRLIFIHPLVCQAPFPAHNAGLDMSPLPLWRFPSLPLPYRPHPRTLNTT